MNTTTLELTDEELRMVETHRQGKAEAQRKIALCNACISKLAEWQKHQMETGLALTFSEFVNACCQDLGSSPEFSCKELYVGVHAMLEAVWETHG